MFNIHLVGAGSLGSVFAVEVARRAAALSVPLKITVYDDDIVEDRNTYAQDFLPKDIGETKASVVSDKIGTFKGIESNSVIGRLDEVNIHDLDLDSHSVLVDCVDNVKTRHLLEMQGMLTNTPVLHLGMAMTGSGNVDWNFESYNTFNLSMANITPEKMAEIEKGQQAKLPPCELNGFRTLILNTALAGVNSLFIFLGKDINKEFVDEDNNVVEMQGLFSNWTTTMQKMELNRAITHVTENFPNVAATAVVELVEA